LKNYDKALKNFKESGEIFNSLQQKRSSAWTLGNIASVYKSQKDYPSAIVFYQKALQLQEESNDFKDKIAITLMNLGELNLEMKNLNDASSNFEKAYELFEQAENKEGMAKVIYNMGKLYTAGSLFQKATNAHLLSIDIAQKIGNQELLAANYFALAQVYRLMNQCQQAFQFNSLFLSTKDSIYNADFRNKLTEMQIQYETEKKDKEIELLKKDSQIKEVKQQRERVAFIALALVLFSVLVFLYQFSLKIKAYKLLVKKNMEVINAENKLDEPVLLINTEISDDKNIEIPGNENQSNILVNQLIALMKDEKIYIDKEASLNKISDILGTNRTYLSEAIHKYLNTNFNDFLNEYRIKKSCKLLIDSDYQNMTIEAIASMVGFSTKATFNNAFKKFTGVTPSYFKNSRKEFTKQLSDL
jgi:AraC-like DNA-binding protein